MNLCPSCRKPLDGSGRCVHCTQGSKTLSQTLPTTGDNRSQSRPAQGPPAAAPVKFGPYAIVRELGRGGMGRVLEAVDEPLGRRVAVKVLLSPTPGNSPHRRRFIEEARITGGLEHPGIAPIYSLGRAPDGSEYFSMKLVAGRTLGDVLKDRESGNREVVREYSLTRLLSIFERVVETIAYAHARGVLHRDLKPANIMVGAHGEVWVLDWGLAKLLGKGEPEPAAPAAPAAPRPAGGDQEITVAGSLVGTPQYMAPEQARGGPLDVRTDVYGLGGVLYRMLTGQSPNQGADYLGTVMSAAMGELSLVRATKGGRRAPVKLAAIAEKCLAAKPEDRYPSAGELLADLRAYAAGEAITARPDGWAGKLFRLVRRYHRIAFVLGTAAALLLIGCTVAATMLAAQDRRALKAERDAQTAEQARQAALNESAARSQRRMQAFRPYAEATDLLMRGQLFDQAAKHLEQALKIDPDFPEAQFALGEALRLAGLPARAALAYLKANELSRQIAGRPHLQALLAAGMTFDDAGDYAQAEQCFIQVDREGAGHPLALVGKAFRLGQERKLPEARAVAEEALRRAPHYWETHFACGYILEELVNNGYVPPEPSRTQAVALLRKALELSPRQAEAWTWLARTLQHADPAEAMRLFDHAIALEPRNGNRYITRGLNRLGSGNAAGAAADFQKARELGAARPLLLLADATVAAGKSDYETAFRLMGELIGTSRAWPSHLGNWLVLGFQLRRDKEVRARFDEWCRNNPEYAEVYALRAQLKARDSDFAGAVVEDRAGLKIAAWNRKLRTQLALHLSLAKQWKDALTATDAVLELAPNDFSPQTFRARCLVELGRAPEAKLVLDRLQKDFPTRARELDDLRRSLGDRLPK